MLNLLAIADPAGFQLIESKVQEQGLAARCRRVAGGEELSRALKEHRPDVALVSHAMPGPDLREVLTLIRKDYPHLPVILLSHRARQEEAMQMLKAGVWDFVLTEDLIPLVHRIERCVADAEGRRTAHLSEKALRQSEERYRSLVETIFDWVWEVDVDGRYTYASPRARDILGYAPDEVIGRTPYDFMAKEEAPRMKKILAGIAAERRSFTALENINVHRDGRLIVLETTGVPVFLSDGHFAGYRGVDRDVTDQKKAEMALRVSEERYRTLTESSAVAILHIDINYRIVSCNKAFLKLFNYKRKEIEEKSITLLYPSSESFRSFREACLPVIGKGGTFIHVQELIRKDGKPMPVEWVASGVRDPDAKVVGQVAIIRDIAKRRAAEEALRMSEERFRLTFDQSPIGAVIADSESRVLRANSAFCRITGFSQKDLLGLSLIDITDPEDKQKSLEQVAALAGGKVRQYNMEKRYITKKGAIVWVRVSVGLLKGQDTRSIHFLGLVEDITKQRKAEEALKESEAKYRLVTGNMPVGIYSVLADSDATLVLLTGRIRGLAGYSPREFERNPRLWFDLVHPHDRESFEKFVRQQQTVAGHCVAEYRIVTKAGITKWIRDSSTPLMHNKGQVVQITGFVEDISERKKAEEELRESHNRLRDLSVRLESLREEERREIARELHDEVGQGLTVLKLGLQTLHRQTKSARAVNSVKGCLETCERVLNQVRSLSLNLRPSILDDLGLLPALRWLISSVGKAADWKTDLFYEEVIPRLKPEVETACFRIVQEAISNAARHANARSLDVRLRNRVKELEIIIEDDGAGFDVPSMQKRSSEGAGFGLLGMKERAMLIGGKVEVASMPGKGTTVKLLIPAGGV